MFLIYINNLSNDIKTISKLFVDEISLFSVAHNINTVANDFSHDHEISKLALQWKMKFNPDPTKQTQEVIFSKKKAASVHLVVHFNNTLVNSVK